MVDLNNLPRRVYSIDGNQLEVEGVDVEKGWVFARIMYDVYLSDELGSVDNLGEIRTWRAEDLFDTPTQARAKVDQHVKEQADKVEALKLEQRRIQQDIRDMNVSSKALLEEAKKWQGLEYLVDIISGKNMWCVEFLNTYGSEPPFRIVPIEEALVYKEDERYSSSWKKDFKLLTLHGRTKGDLQWRLGQYPDHSGYSRQVWFYPTREEAVVAVTQMLHDTQNPEKAKLLDFRISASSYMVGCAALGVQPMPEVEQAIKDQTLAAALKAVETQQKALVEAQNKLRDLTIVAVALQPKFIEPEVKVNEDNPFGDRDA